MPIEPASQSVRAVQLLRQQGMVRLSEFTKASITAATISRMEQRGEVVKLGRGLYQQSDFAGEIEQFLNVHDDSSKTETLLPRRVTKVTRRRNRSRTGKTFV